MPRTPQRSEAPSAEKTEMRDIFADREALFAFFENDVAKAQGAGDRRFRQLSAVGFLMQHSIQDGIDLLERTASNGVIATQDILDIFSGRFNEYISNNIKFKQPDFLRAVLFASVREFTNGTLNASNAETVSAAFQTLWPEKAKKFIHENRSDAVTQWDARIAAYYAAQLADKKLRVDFPPDDTDPAGERNAKQVIFEYAQAYRKETHINQAIKIWADVWADLMGPFGPNEKHERADFERAVYEKLFGFGSEEIKKILLQETVTPDEFKKVLDLIQNVTPVREAALKAEYGATRIRPMQPLIKASQDIARTEITKEVRASLKARGVPDSAYEIVYDALAREVRVVWNAEGKEQEQTATPKYEVKEFVKPEFGRMRYGAQYEVMEYGTLYYNTIGRSDLVSVQLLDDKNTESGRVVEHKPRYFLTDEPAYLTQESATTNGTRQLSLCKHQLRKSADPAKRVTEVLVENLESEVEGIEGIPSYDGRVRFVRIKFAVDCILLDLHTKRSQKTSKNLVPFVSRGNTIFVRHGRDGWTRKFSFDDIDFKAKATLVMPPDDLHHAIDVVPCSVGLADRLVIYGDISGALSVFASDQELFKYSDNETYIGTKFANGVPVIITHKRRQGADGIVFTAIFPDKTTETTTIDLMGVENILNRVNITDCFVSVFNKKLQVTFNYRSEQGLVYLRKKYQGDLVTEGPFSGQLYRKDGFLISAHNSVDGLQLGCSFTDDRGVIKDRSNFTIPGVFGSFYFKEVGNSVAVIVCEPEYDRVVKIITFPDDAANESVHPELTEQEKDKLDLLNIALNPTKENVVRGVQKFFPPEPKSLDEAKERRAEKLQKSPTFLRTVQGMIRSAAKDLPLARHLFKTMAAQPAGNDAALADRILLLMFPELAMARVRKAAKGGRMPLKEMQGSLAPLLETGIFGADPNPNVPGSEMEMIQLREPVHGFLATNVYSEYQTDSKTWRVPHQEFRVTPQVGEPAHETTATIKVHGAHLYVLPLQPGAELIEQRVKSFDRAGKELGALVVKYVAGLPQVTPPAGAEKIVYSFRYSVVPPVPAEASSVEYEQLARQWHRARIDASKKLLPEDKIAELPPECRMFVHGIATLPPRERLQRIENFVREHSYYDFDNGSVMHLKAGKSPTETFQLMRGRMAEIRRTKPELKAKIFAGVCSDFNLLVAAMNQASGFVGGMMLGFNAHGSSVTKAQAHAVAWVAWPPSADGQYTVITTDGTPAGTTPDEEKMLADIRMQSIVERAAAQEEAERVYDEKHAAEFERTLALLEHGTVDEIRLLTNGTIEQAVNVVLRKDAQHRDAHVLQHILNVLLYSPVSFEKFDWRNINQRIDVVRFVDEEVTRERLRHTRSVAQEKPGAQIMDAFLTFLKKYQRRYPDHTSQQPLDLLEHVFDSIRGHITPTEQRIATVLITYLRAKQMIKIS